MGFTDIPAVLEASFSGEHYINLFRFQQQHPYIVNDNPDLPRRFMTLEAAADAAYSTRGTTVTDADGKVYTWEDCRAISGRGKRIHSW